MKPIKGELRQSQVYISNPKDVGRLYQKSKLGQPASHDSLYLTLIESLYLVEEQKLTIYKDDERFPLKKLVSYATIEDPCFEEKYVVFRDLRKRGIQVQSSPEESYTFYCEKKDEHTQTIQHNYVTAISEREIPSIFTLKQLMNQTERKNAHLWLAIVDEEGDITYYELQNINPEGVNKHHDYDPIQGLLLSNRVVVFDPITCERIHAKEFFGKPFANGLQLSLVEAYYLIKKEILHCTTSTDQQELSPQSFMDHVSYQQQDISKRYQVFSDLKNKGLVVKTGFKFGTHFRAYKKSPFHSHAEYLIHTIDETYETQWPEISRAVRLAHAVNKTLLFALIETETTPPTYLSFQRIRP